FLLSEWEQVVDARQLQDWESYRDAPRLGPEDETRRDETGGALADLRTRAGRPARAGHGDVAGSLRADGGETEGGRAVSLPLRGRRRGSGSRRSAVAIRRGAGYGPGEQPVLRGRPGAADFSAALLVEGAGRGCAGAIVDIARQLPDLAPDPKTGGSS